MRIQPGSVLTTESGWYLPVASAAAMLNGLTVEPGSKTSIMARLRIAAGCRLRRLFGL